MKHCQDGIIVDVGNIQYYDMFNKLFLYGHYEIQTSEINDRPYFKKGNYGLWWSYGYWIIGSDVMK